MSPEVETYEDHTLLRWRVSSESHCLIGQVEVDIELDSGRTVTYKASPMNVAVIMAFQEQGMY